MKFNYPASNIESSMIDMNHNNTYKSAHVDSIKKENSLHLKHVNYNFSEHVIIIM